MCGAQRVKLFSEATSVINAAMGEAGASHRHPGLGSGKVAAGRAGRTLILIRRLPASAGLENVSRQGRPWNRNARGHKAGGARAGGPGRTGRPPRRSRGSPPAPSLGAGSNGPPRAAAVSGLCKQLLRCPAAAVAPQLPPRRPLCQPARSPLTAAGLCRLCRKPDPPRSLGACGACCAHVHG